MAGPLAQWRVFLFSFLAIPATLPAQAWLFPKGDGTVSLSYQNIFVRQHSYSNVDRMETGHILSHAVTIDTDYSLTDKIALRITLPFIAARYYGSRPHAIQTDNGVDRKSTRLNSSHIQKSRMPSSA